MRVFDFDNTIYDGESGFHAFLYFLKKDVPGLLKIAPKFFQRYIEYRKGTISVADVFNEFGDFAKEYCSRIEDVYGEFEKFWDLHEDRVKKFYFDMQDEEDIIVSACPMCLLQIICDRIGIKHIIGSDIDPIKGEINNICYSESKVVEFRKVYGDVMIDDFYTDSISDKPMMDISKNVFWVDGEKITQIKKDGIELASFPKK